MDDHSLNPGDGDALGSAPETPEDVAVLYTWANVHGGKYRDFSASRREFRAQQRHRLMEAQRQAELEAARAKEEAAARDMEEARRAGQEAAHNVAWSAEAEENRRRAEERAVQEQMEAQRHVEAAEELKRALDEAQREMEEARRRAEEQAARYAEADARYRASTRREELPGEIEDPYYYAGPVDPESFAPGKGVRSSVPQRVSSERRITQQYYRSRGSSGERPAQGESADFAGTSQAGQRRRGGSGASERHQDISHLSVDRTETPEEMRERNRPDELERRRDYRGANAYEGNDDDGYYDHAQPLVRMRAEEPASRLQRNRPASSLPPRESVAEDRRIGQQEDPTPGNTHVPDASRMRRRESATDITVRTARRPRESRAMPAAGSADAGYLDSAAMRGTATSFGEPYVSGSGFDSASDRGVEDGRSESRDEGFGAPEWLIREGTPTQPTSPAPSGRAPSEPRSEPVGERRERNRTGARRLERRPTADDRLTREVRVASVPPDSLQQSRELVAARWFAMKGLVGSPGESSGEMQARPRTRDAAAPMLAVMSLSGGVGKTSLVATMGRALSAVGERVLLADVTPHGLLPYYFGARELRPDVVRTFSPPAGSRDAAVLMVNYEAERWVNDEAGQAALLEQIAQHAREAQRVLLDVSGGSAWLASRLAAQDAAILVPVAPDMNSVLGIRNLERMFSGVHDAEGRAVQPNYVLNQFDASLPLHLDVREVLRQQLGDRLLPVMIRRSPAVAEALAEGMTVIDYAPGSPVTEDYSQLAEWIRGVPAAGRTGVRGIRWSER